MIALVLLLAPIVMGVAAVFFLFHRQCAQDERIAERKKEDRYYHEYATDWEFGAWVTAGLTALYALSVVGGLFLFNADHYGSVLKNDTRQTMVDVKTRQRDELAAIVSRELSPDQMAALATVTDPDAAVIAVPELAASTVMVERAKQFVSLNQDVQSFQNDLLLQRLDLCAAERNMFMPLVPWVKGACR